MVHCDHVAPQSLLHRQTQTISVSWQDITQTVRCLTACRPCLPHSADSLQACTTTVHHSEVSVLMPHWVGLSVDSGADQQTEAAHGGKHHLSGGAIAGLVLGVVAACVLAAVLGLLLLRRRTATPPG
jgi:hypothetical protein